jgi:hypothetical protein
VRSVAQSPTALESERKETKTQKKNVFSSFYKKIIFHPY